jgi:hypothetical protein
MSGLLDWVGKIQITSDFRSAEKQEAITVWNRGLIWDDAALKKIIDDSREKKASFDVVCIIVGLWRGANSDGHLSLYRAFGRQNVAEHFVDMLQNCKPGEPLRHGLKFYERWAHIEHVGFWREAASYLNQVEGLNMWGVALDAAAYCGNLVPLQLVEPQVLRYWATNLSQLSKAGQMARKTYMVHPTVAKWFLNEGLWNQADIEAQVNSRTCPLEGNGFMGMQENVVCESGYVADMCEMVLRDYNLSVEKTARFVGQALLSLGVDYWNDVLATRLAPYLGDIELDALKAVCGQLIFVNDPDEQSLYNTLQKATHAVRGFSAEQAHFVMREGLCPHKGLLFLMDLDPPQDRVALYHLGAMALRIRRQKVKEPEVFSLPNLD